MSALDEIVAQRDYWERESNRLEAENEKWREQFQNACKHGDEQFGQVLKLRAQVEQLQTDKAAECERVVAIIEAVRVSAPNYPGMPEPAVERAWTCDEILRQLGEQHG